MLLSAPPALAVPPANDDFADAQVLGPALPVETTGTTIGSTGEVGEPTPAVFAFNPSGRTVWFEWEATSTGFVTVDTCGSQISTALGVYTGSTVDALTEVAGDFSSTGPDCSTPFGSVVTFKALSGVTYEILVEGRAIFPEGASGGEGSFVLELAATPQPPNDDFADATVLNGQVLENRVYAAGAEGFNWNATKEGGEPQHAGDPGGASVWYSWTAPVSDAYLFGGGGRFLKTLIGIYTGSAVDALTPVAVCAGCTMMLLRASAGTTYRIAFDGAFDSGSGAPAVGSLWLNISNGPPPPPVELESPTIGLPWRPPEIGTSIRKRIVKRAQRRATFIFRSNKPDAKFRCKLDQRPFAACRSPRTYRNLAPGRHTFKVFAIDLANNTDRSPAVARFTIDQRR